MNERNRIEQVSFSQCVVLVSSVISSYTMLHKALSHRIVSWTTSLLLSQLTVCSWALCAVGTSHKYCETPTLPRKSFHIVVAGYSARTCFRHYLWDLGLSNADVFIYRRVQIEEPAKSWQGPCGVRAQEVILGPNHGRDAAAFYDYVLNVYANPPAAFLFLHGHGGVGAINHITCECDEALDMYASPY